MAAVPQRDHLFISYATEDAAFADWVVRKLLSEGYKVWYDRLKLLGGESYPSDIDVAIKEQSFRLLALLSASSLRKSNPLKERTLALNISRERKIPFLIPLLIEPLSPADLDWMTSDLTHIPFHDNWASGFASLLERLRSLETPCDPESTRQAICDWSAAQDQPIQRSEQLWTNLLPLLEVPEVLRGYELTEPVARGEPAARWPHYMQAKIAWAFEAPQRELGIKHGKPTQIHWPSFFEYQGMKVRDAVTYLVKQSLVVHCLGKGAQAFPSDDTRVYFPQGLFPDDKLWYMGYTGKRTSIKVTGERTFYSKGRSIKNRYHLAVGFRPVLHLYAQPVVQLGIRLHLTDEEGCDLDTATAFRRSKRIRKYWWNHQWLSRMLAISSWIADGADSVNILHGGTGQLAIGRLPFRVDISQGINEDTLASLEDDNDEIIVDDDEPVEREEE